MDSDFESFENDDVYSCSFGIQVVEKNPKKQLHFHLCLQTNEQCYCLLRLTNHSSALQLVFGTKRNVLSDAGFLHLKLASVLITIKQYTVNSYQSHQPKHCNKLINLSCS